MNNLTAFSRFEFIDSISFSENTTQTLRTNGGLIPNDRFMNGLLLEFRGRLTMPGSTGPSADRQQIAQIMERITVEGYHRGRKQQEKIIDARGSDLELLQRFYLPSALVKLPGTTSAITITASATNDIICQVFVPFTPLRIPAHLQSGYLLDAPNYDSLKLTVQWGDFKSVVVPGTTAATWSAYGSASGSPELRVHGQFAIQKARFANFVPGRVFRYFQEITGSLMTTTATGVRLWDIPRGFDIRSILLRSGTKATDATAGNNTFATQTEFLNDIRINMGLGRYIRRYMDYNAIHADVAESYNLPGRITGAGVIDFAQYGSLSETLNTRALVSGPTGNVDLYLQADVTGASNQALVALLEEIRYKPVMG
jgi:hypothetical protein